MRQLHKKPAVHRKVYGFEYLTYSAFSLCLLVILVLLPLAPVFADENIVAQVVPIPAVPQVITNETSSPVPDAVVEQPVLSDTMITEVATVESVNNLGPNLNPDANVETITDATGISTETISNLTVTTTSEEIVDSTVDLSSQNSVTEEPLATELVISELPLLEEASATSSEVSEAVVDETVSTDATSPESQDTYDVPSDTASTDSLASSTVDQNSNATTTLPETVSVNTVTNDENLYSFAKGECTSMSDAMFYCAKATSTISVTHTDRVFAAPDSGGDKEIYIEKDGVVSAITLNNEEDDAPYFDGASNTIVWHRLIDGRYQIISYDIATEKETQLTHDRYNNMQPNRYGDTTVWQGWVGNDWEIFLLEGDALSMLTDNTTHDIAPSVNGTHIVWQSFETGKWQMKVYDIRTKEINTIENTDGGSIQNPRFVLVYDTKFASGDVETKGYDFTSGKVFPLASLPTQVPSEIPDPDQTGEKRALVAPQTQLKTKVEGVDDASGSAGGAGDGNPDLGDGDIIVPALTSTSTVATSTDTLSTQNGSTTNDIVIPQVLTENASTTAHINDLIITPYVEPILPTIEAPIEVASST